MDPDGSSSSLLLPLIVVVAVVPYLFASLAEGAVASLSRAKVQRLAEQDPHAASRLVPFAERPAFYLGSTAVMRVAALSAASVGLVQLLRGDRAGADTLAGWLALVVGTVVLGWVIPRSVATHWPEEVVLALGAREVRPGPQRSTRSWVSSLLC